MDILHNMLNFKELLILLEKYVLHCFKYFFPGIMWSKVQKTHLTKADSITEN